MNQSYHVPTIRIVQQINEKWFDYVFKIIVKAPVQK